MLRAHAGVLAAMAVWTGQLRGSSAETCQGLYDIDISPSSCSSSVCSSYTTIGNGCSSSNCRSHNNNDCDAWDIRCSSGSAVHIDFRTMQTESSYDLLYVYEGNRFNAGGAQRFSGSSTPTDIQMSGRDAIVAYDTDASGLGSGWSARVRCVSSSGSSYSSSSSSSGCSCPPDLPRCDSDGWCYSGSDYSGGSGCGARFGSNCGVSHATSSTSHDTSKCATTHRSPGLTNRTWHSPCFPHALLGQATHRPAPSPLWTAP